MVVCSWKRRLKKNWGSTRLVVLVRRGSIAGSCTSRLTKSAFPASSAENGAESTFRFVLVARNFSPTSPLVVASQRNTRLTKWML